MKRIALAGVVGITLIGAGSLTWGMRPNLDGQPSARSSMEAPDLRTVGARRHHLEGVHKEVCGRSELKRQMVLGFLAGHVDRETLLKGVEQMNRQTPNCLSFLAMHYPEATEREIAIWHVVGMVDGELEMAHATPESCAQADAWLREQGLVPALAW